MRILIIDDDGKLAGHLKRGLGECGYVVDTASNGVEGRHLAVEGEYQLVLLDVMLPGLDGFAVLEDLRKSKDTPV